MASYGAGCKKASTPSATLERAGKGKPVGNKGLWIAAHARAMGWALVTDNEREFSKVSELRLQNCTK